MLYNILLEVPADLDVTALDDEGNFVIANDAAWEISQLNAYWPARLTPGTQPDNPNKLMHCVVESETTDIKTLIKSLLIGYFPDWTIAGLQSLHNEIPAVLDPETGEELEPARALSIIPCDESIVFKYLPDRYAEHDEDGNPIGDPLSKNLNWLHKYSGQANWI